MLQGSSHPTSLKLLALLMDWMLNSQILTSGAGNEDDVHPQKSCSLRDALRWHLHCSFTVVFCCLQQIFQLNAYLLLWLKINSSKHCGQRHKTTLIILGAAITNWSASTHSHVTAWSPPQPSLFHPLDFEAHWQTGKDLVVVCQFKLGSCSCTLRNKCSRRVLHKGQRV